VTDSCGLTYVHTEDIAVIVVLMTLGLPYIYVLEVHEDPEWTNTKNPIMQACTNATVTELRCTQMFCVWQCSL
jgi:hypothetical protein